MPIFALEPQKLTGLHLPWWDVTSDARDTQLPLHYRRQNRTYAHTTKVAFQNKNVMCSDLHDYYSLLGKNHNVIPLSYFSINKLNSSSSYLFLFWEQPGILMYLYVLHTFSQCLHQVQLVWLAEYVISNCASLLESNGPTAQEVQDMMHHPQLPLTWIEETELIPTNNMQNRGSMLIL